MIVTRGSGRLALAALAFVALALSGCGRRGGLDFPPQAGAPAVAAGDPAQPGQAANNPAGIFDTGDDEQQTPTPQGRKRRIILDRLLD